jgi:hypothetical protein
MLAHFIPSFRSRYIQDARGKKSETGKNLNASLSFLLLLASIFLPLLASIFLRLAS